MKSAGAEFPRRLLAPEVLLALLAASLLLATIGQSHLANYDDCFYAQRAKEMLHGGDWITPHFDGQPRVDNPPVWMWLMALSFSLLGITGYAAILPSALSGVACVVMLYRIARQIGWSPFAALASAFALLTTPYFLKQSGRAMMDIFVTLLFLLAVHCYLLAVAKRREWFVVAGLCVGLGLASKSLIGIFPGVVIVGHLLWTGRGRLLVDPWFLAGALVAAAVGGWWFLYEWRVRPQAFEEKWRWMVYERSVVIDHGGRGWDKYLDYLVDLGKQYWPWLPLALIGAWGSLRRAFDRGGNPAEVSAARLLVLWFAVVLGPLSLANEKKLWYVMSIFPCLALWVGSAAAAWIRGEVAQRRVVTVGTALLAVAALAVNLLPLRLTLDRRPELQRVALAARTLVPAGTPVLNFDLGYDTVNPQFLFYSDRSLASPSHDAAAVRAGLEAGGWALLSPTGYAGVAGADTARYPVAVRSGDWLLVKAGAPVPVWLEPRDPYR